jgi:hypothetical protein
MPAQYGTRDILYSGKKPITTRSQLGTLSKPEKETFEKTLIELNDKFGYFGGPPVPRTLLLDYYFDEPPKGAWPKVTVSVNRKDTGISFYNRAQNARFLGDVCKEHIGPMRDHVPVAPPDRE